MATVAKGAVYPQYEITSGEGLRFVPFSEAVQLVSGDEVKIGTSVLESDGNTRPMNEEELTNIIAGAETWAGA